MLLALLKTTAGKGVIRVDAQHSAPSRSCLLVVPQGVVDGREVEACVEVVTSAADGRFEIRGGLLKPLPAKVEETALVQACAWFGVRRALFSGASARYGRSSATARGHLRQRMKMVWHGVG